MEGVLVGLVMGRNVGIVVGGVLGGCVIGNRPAEMLLWTAKLKRDSKFGEFLGTT